MTVQFFLIIIQCSIFNCYHKICQIKLLKNVSLKDHCGYNYHYPHTNTRTHAVPAKIRPHPRAARNYMPAPAPHPQNFSGGYPRVPAGAGTRCPRGGARPAQISNCLVTLWSKKDTKSYHASMCITVIVAYVHSHRLAGVFFSLF